MTGSHTTARANSGRQRATGPPGSGIAAAPASGTGGLNRSKLLAPVAAGGSGGAAGNGRPGGANNNISNNTSGISLGSAIGSGVSSSTGPGHARAGAGGSRDDLSAWRYVLEMPLGPDDGDHVHAYPPRRTAKAYPDFYPWRHTKEEDARATECVQQGYFEPTKVTNEGGSARNTMLPLIKQWTSLPALSFFLANAMEMRDRSCRITSSSTFKPPPRVTLTDQKRESWLRDLASPHVPLRRLARTIPHGIRNRSLLEQCCTKLIPVPRAVWFARCVGANELRGLRRKGAGTALHGTPGAAGPGTSETAWIQEWSQEVFAFIEKVAGEHGHVHSHAVPPATTASASPDPNRPGAAQPTAAASSEPVPWKTRMEYVARLTAYLFNEGLVDRHLFLEWVVSFVERGPIASVPVALMFARTFWRHLAASRERSRALAVALLKAYCRVEPLVVEPQKDTATLKSVADSLRATVRQLFATCPDAFIMAREWKELGPVLLGTIRGSDDSTAATTDPTLLRRLDSIRLTNEAMVASDSPRARLMRNPRHAAIAYLDGLRAPFDPTAIADRLHDVARWDQTIAVLVEWATTRSRTGAWRLYLCLDVCSTIASRGVDVMSAVLAFLTSITSPRRYNMSTIHLLVSELAQTDERFVGAYFRRLIATSILSAGGRDEMAHTQLQIMANIPGVTLPLTLQAKMNSLVVEHTEVARQLDAVLRQCLGFLLDQSSDASRLMTPDERGLMARANLATKLEHVDTIIDVYESRISQGYVPHFRVSLKTSTNSSFMPSQSHLAVIFDYLEATGDMRAVCHIVWTTVGHARAYSSTLLYFLTMYVTGHLDCFLVMGHFENLVALFVREYNQLKVKTKMTREFSGLAQFVLSKCTDMDANIKSDLEAFLRPLTQPSPMYISTLSPMSETMIGAPEAISAEAEHVLGAMGISLGEVDSAAFGKYFVAVADKLLDYCAEPCNADGARTAAMALYYLKDMELDNAFEEQLVSWLRDKLQPDNVLQTSRFAAMAVIYDCASLEQVFNRFSEPKDGATPDTSRHMLLSLVLSRSSESWENSSFALKPSERLKLDLHRRSFLKSKTRECLVLITDDICSETTEGVAAVDDSVLKVLSQVAGTRLDLFSSTVIQPMVDTNLSQIYVRLVGILNALVGIDRAPDAASDLSSEFAATISVCDEFNVRVCQERLSVVLKLARLGVPSEALSSMREDFAKSVLEAATDAYNRRLPKNIIGDLVVSLDADWKAEILYQAELRALDARLIQPTTHGIIGYFAEIIDAVSDSAERDFPSQHADHICKFVTDVINLTQDRSGDDKQDGLLTQDVRDATQLLIKVIMIHTLNPSQPPGKNTTLHETLVNGLSVIGEYFKTTKSDEIATLVGDTINALKGDGARTAEHMPVGLTGNPDSLPLSGWYSSDGYTTDLACYVKQTDVFRDLRISPFDLLEDGNPSMSVNDVPLDLATFDCTIDQRNPR